MKLVIASILILFIRYADAGPVKTSLCCCGCTKEPCPSVGPTCGSPRQSCGGQLDIDVVRCDELQRLWDLAELRRENDTVNTEDASSPGFTPFLSESGIPYAIHDKVSQSAMKDFFEKKNFEKNGTSALEIRFSPQKKEKSDKLTIKRIDNMLTELEDMIAMMRGLTADVSAIEEVEKKISKFAAENTSSLKTETPAEIEGSSDSENPALDDTILTSTVSNMDVEHLSEHMNISSNNTSNTNIIDDSITVSTTPENSEFISEGTEGTSETDPSLDFLFEGALPDDEESKAIDEVIRRMKESIGKLSKADSSKASSLFQVDSSISTGSPTERRERVKRAAGENCNDLTLKNIITDNIAHDAKSSKRAIQKAAEKEFGGSFNVICSPCEFSFVVSSQKFCEGYKDQLACFVFLQPPTTLTN